jgi:ABC-2 type transport system ATP-binding protein
MLRVSGISKRYGRQPALEAVGFGIQAGEVLGLIGPNGAGKTTLFECMAGIMPMDAGALLQAGARIDAARRRELLFYLPDAIAPWPDQPLGWALDFTIGFFRGRADLYEEIVASLTLQPLLGARIGSLSKGQRKRALLGIGLLAPQPLLLVDEPFDGLDLRQSREVALTLRSHATRGRTLFLSIHQIADASRLCDRFVLLSSGRVCGEGTLDDLAALAAARLPHADAFALRSQDLEEIFLALT